MRLGDLLVAQGVMTASQRDAVLEEQQRSGRPFGDIAERLLGVSREAIERAWAEQYTQLAARLDPMAERVDPRAVALVSRRQAWQFRVLPLRFEGRDLVVCTTAEHLVRALRFCTWHLGHHCYFVTSEAEALGRALMAHYPLAGMEPGVVARGVAR